MNKSEQINELAAALSKAQGEFPAITKNRTVKVKTKTGGEYSFDYATLDHIIALVRPSLSKQGLTIQWGVGYPPANTEAHALVACLSHSSGQHVSTGIPLGSWGDEQELGRRITYYARYLVTGLLGICAEEDEDGNLNAGNHAEKQPAKRATPSSDGTKFKLPLEEALLAIEACKDVSELMRVYQERTIGKPEAFIETVKAKASWKKSQLQPTS